MNSSQSTFSMKKVKHSREIDEHIFALIHGMQSACQLAELLPEGDLADELSTLLEIQYGIITEFAKGRHYGSEQIEDFINFSQRVVEQIESLRSPRDAI